MMTDFPLHEQKDSLQGAKDASEFLRHYAKR